MRNSASDTMPVLGAPPMLMLLREGRGKSLKGVIGIASEMLIMFDHPLEKGLLLAAGGCQRRLTRARKSLQDVAKAVSYEHNEE